VLAQALSPAVAMPERISLRRSMCSLAIPTA
jgi:hypothetical protein